MWVRVFAWMLADDQPPHPDAGSMLRSVGVRVRGEVTVADSATPDGVAVVPNGDSADSHRSVYTLTGIAGDAQDLWSDTGRRRERNQPSGAEFVLKVGEDRFQAQFSGHASEVLPDSRVTVTGGLELVGEYEWDAFGLVDTRADWIVTRVVALPDGDISVALAHPAGD
jgi:hypothetical protein